MYALFSAKNLAHNGLPLTIERINIPLTEYLQEMEKENPY
jgi:hypothetical protein